MRPGRLGAVGLTDEYRTALFESLEKYKDTRFPEIKINTLARWVGIKNHALRNSAHAGIPGAIFDMADDSLVLDKDWTP